MVTDVRLTQPPPDSEMVPGDDELQPSAPRYGEDALASFDDEPSRPSVAPSSGGGLGALLTQLGLTKPDTTKSDALTAELQKLWTARQGGLSEAVGRRRADVATAKGDVATMAAARAAAKPDPLALPQAPVQQPRAFAEPRPSADLFSQMNAVLLGAGQMAIQMAGLRGPHSLALASLKGALEGWQAGDNQRMEREMAAWERETKRLLAEHKDKTERYQQLIQDQGLSWSQKFSLLGLEAANDQFQDMVLSSKEKNIEHLLASQQKADAMQQRVSSDFVKTLIGVEKWRAEQEETKRHRLVLEEEQRLTREERGEQKRLDRESKDEQKRLDRESRDANQVAIRDLKETLGKLSAGTTAQGLDLRRQGLDIQREALDLKRQLGSDKREEKQKGYRTMGRVLDDMENMVEPMQQAGLLPKTEGRIDDWRASAARWTKPNQDMWRQWMALQGAMVGFERQVYDDKGARALSVFKSLLDFVERPPTAETAKIVIKRMRGYLDDSKDAPVKPDTAGWEILPPPAAR